jgi:putative PIN family toxin of toxin-antitoxin system
VRVVLDTTILVRAGASPHGLARHLLLALITAKHPLILSNEMLHELAKVLRYPRVVAIHGLPETQIYDFVEFLREAAEIVPLNPVFTAPIRDVNDLSLRVRGAKHRNGACSHDRHNAKRKDRFRMTSRGPEPQKGSLRNSAWSQIPQRYLLSFG